MLFGLLKRRTPAPPNPADTLYAAIVAAARRPAFYDALEVPDSFPGRFEMTVLHAALVMRRLRADGGPDALGFSQALFDAMFRALDANLRELGVGDATVPKRMKAMARSFFDGAVVYDLALDARDENALAEALRRIVYANAETSGDGPRRLSAYVFAAEATLGAQSAPDVLTGQAVFPDIEGDHR